MSSSQLAHRKTAISESSTSSNSSTAGKILHRSALSSSTSRTSSRSRQQRQRCSSHRRSVLDHEEKLDLAGSRRSHHEDSRSGSSTSTVQTEARSIAEACKRRDIGKRQDRKSKDYRSSVKSGSLTRSVLDRQLSASRSGSSIRSSSGSETDSGSRRTAKSADSHLHKDAAARLHA